MVCRAGLWLAVAGRPDRGLALSSVALPRALIELHDTAGCTWTNWHVAITIERSAFGQIRCPTNWRQISISLIDRRTACFLERWLAWNGCRERLTDSHHGHR